VLSDNVAERQFLFGVFRPPISRALRYQEFDDRVARFAVLDERRRPMLVRVLQHPEYPGRV
jgi:hypothetical protein